ncbi:MAG: hypothetical protein ABW076_13115 [Candidatus Thiodiazotropha sp.]
MERKYLLFNNPLSWLGVLAGIGALYLFMEYFAHALRDYEFAVGFILAVISVVMVNLCYWLERRHLEKSAPAIRQEESD